MPSVEFEPFISAIGSGKFLASFPTDTVPALAARPESAELIYQAKQRSLDKPLILMAGEIEQLWDYLVGTESEQAVWRSLMTQYWPGALTLVLPASQQLPACVNPTHSGTIGVRVPNHELARAILRQTGPLATTSANRSGEPAILDMAQIAQTFPEVLCLCDQALQDLQVDAKQLLASGQPSTIVAWRGDHWQVLRQGSVILPEIILQPGPRSIQ